jgi:hypothetical protein
MILQAMDLRVLECSQVSCAVAQSPPSLRLLATVRFEQKVIPINIKKVPIKNRTNLSKEIDFRAVGIN